MDYKLSPDSQIEIGAKVYKLDASFGTFAAIQEAMKDDIVRILMRITSMRQDEIATIIALASGEERNDIGQRLVDLGIATAAYAYIVSQLMAWLSIALCPKQEREKKTAEMAGFLARMKNPTSPGKTTDSSPSESSATPAPSSTPATSGT